MNVMRVRAYDIRYDTDGLEIDLPSELIFTVDLDERPDFDPAEELADMISDQTGWCIFGCQFEILE